MEWPSNIPLPSTIALGLFVLVLGGKLLVTSPPNFVGPAEAAEVSENKVANSIGATNTAPIDLAAYSATLDRPLFDPSRRPLVISQTEEIAPVVATIAIPDASDIRLSGFMESNGIARGYLISLQNRQWVSVGDSFDGWNVTELSSAHVVLEQGAHVHEVHIYE